MALHINILLPRPIIFHKAEKGVEGDTTNTYAHFHPNDNHLDILPYYRYDLHNGRTFRIQYHYTKYMQVREVKSPTFANPK